VRGFSRALAGGIIVIALSQALVLGYASISLGLYAGCCAAMVVASSFVGIPRPAWRMPTGAGAVVIVTCIALLTQGIALGDGHEDWKWVYAALIALAPWCAVLASRVAWRSDLRRLAGTFAGACIPAGTAILLSAWQYFSSDAPAW
jgi:hypothetical protein